MDRAAGRPPRQAPGEVYGVEQLLEDLAADRCPCDPCDFPNPGGSLMCRGHWRLIPADGKREVYEAVKRVNGIATRYEAAALPAQQDSLATLFFEAETEMRECQLRAVIVASERAGARPA